MMRLLPCVQDANWPGWQGWQVALWVGWLKEYRETLVREELGAHEAALAQAGGHSDWAADQALRLQQCSYFAGVCCPNTAPALAGLESFPSIMAGTAEWWGAPGAPQSQEVSAVTPPALAATTPCSRTRWVPTLAPADHSHSSSKHHPFPHALQWCLWQPFCLLLPQSWIALVLPGYFPTDNCAVNILGVVLLSLILAPGAAWSCFLDRKAATDRDLTQSNYPNL